MLFLTCLGIKFKFNKKTFGLEKKFLRIKYFWIRNGHISPLFRESHIPKLSDKIALENCLFINKYFIKVLRTIFKNWFTLSSDFRTYSTRWSNLVHVVVPPHNTKLCGRNSVNISTIYTRNYLKKLNENNIFYQLSPNAINFIIKKFFSKNYN